MIIGMVITPQMRKQGNWLKFRTSELGLWPDLLGSFHPLLPEGVEFGWEAMIQKEQGGEEQRCQVQGYLWAFSEQGCYWLLLSLTQDLALGLRSLQQGWQALRPTCSHVVLLVPEV